MDECNGASCRLTAIRQTGSSIPKWWGPGGVRCSACTESPWAPPRRVHLSGHLVHLSPLSQDSPLALPGLAKLRCEKTPEQRQQERRFLLLSMSQERVKCSVRTSSWCWAVGMRPPCKVGVWHLDAKLCHKTKCGCWEGSWGKEGGCDAQSAVPEP